MAQPTEEIHELMRVHNKARNERRELEREQNELPAALEYAMSQSDVAEIQRLNRRKRELPEEYQVASSVEHAAYSKLSRVQSNEQQRLATEAHRGAERAAERLSLLRHENRLADELAVKALEKQQRAADVAEREVETWATRFSQADSRFRAAIKEQQPA
jgi:hypothetical protein